MLLGGRIGFSMMTRRCEMIEIETKEKWYQALGWMHAEACITMERGGE